MAILLIFHFKIIQISKGMLILCIFLMIQKNLDGMKEIGCKEEKTFHLEIIMRLSNKLINHENYFKIYSLINY